MNEPDEGEPLVARLRLEPETDEERRLVEQARTAEDESTVRSLPEEEPG